jgi:hypothetical protein
MMAGAMAPRSHALLGLFGALLAPASALAEQPDSPPPAEQTAPSTPAQPSCTVGQRAAFAELACELARALHPLPAGALVVAAPAQSTIELPKPEALAARLATVTAGALGRGAHASAIAASLTRARALAHAAGTLVHLKPRVADGQLRVVGDVYPVPENFWDRVRDPRPNPTDHAFASRRLDAELRTFLPPVPLVAGRVHKARSSEQEPVALGCDDVDGDGAVELVLVGRRQIQLGRIRGGRFAAHASVSWAELSPVAQSPLREPMGGVAIVPGRHLDVGISDRARLIRFDPSLTVMRTSDRRIPWPAGGCSRLQGLRLRPALEPCFQGDPAPAQPDFGEAADAIGGQKYFRLDGSVQLVRVGRVANDAVALLLDASGRSARVPDVGAQLAVGDVDGDGQPELLTSANTLDPAADQLVVRTWLQDGRVQERFRLGVPTGVGAVAVCPCESAGLSPIAIATRGAVWIVQ